MESRPPAARRLRALLPWAPLALYVAALNPYFIPDVYDDVTYFFSAKSLAEHGQYAFQGEPVRRWPPLFPALLAVPQALGLTSPLFGKLLVVGSVALALGLMRRLWRAEGRPHGELTAVLYACLPWSLMTGAALLSEWPCIALSFMHLVLARKLDPARQPWRHALAAGAVLGLAVLTRWVAALLGVALAAQLVGKLWAQRSLRAVWPELVAGLVAATLVVAWFAVGVRSASHIPGLDAGTGQEVIDVPDPVGAQRERDFYGQPTVVRAAERLSNLLFFQSHPLGRLGLEHHPVSWSFFAPLLLIALGVVVRTRRRELEPSDIYALCTTAFFGYFALQQMRYFLPVAPFLIHYLGLGAESLASWLARRPVQLLQARAGKVLAGGWLAWLVTACVLLLAAGNLRTYGGLSPLSSPEARSFYRGYWRDLYEVSAQVARDPTLAPVAVLGRPGAVRYVLAFSGQPTRHYPPRGDEGSLLRVHPAPLEPALVERLGLQEISRVGDLSLYRVTRRAAAR